MIASAVPPTETGFWDQLQGLCSLRSLPSRLQYVDALEGVSSVHSLLLVALGVVYLLYGWQAFKVLVIANAAALGVVAGAAVGAVLDGPNVQIIAAIACGLLLAVLSWPLMKGAVSIMGALAGGFLGYTLWCYVAGLSGSAAPSANAWAGGLIGLITLGMLGFVVFQETIIIFSAVQGAVCAVSGILAVLLKFDAIHSSLRQNLLGSIHLLPILIAVPVVIGLACQHTGAAKKRKKKLKPASG